MRHLGNTHNPTDVENAKRDLALSHHEMHDPRGRERAWQRHLEYLSDKVLGEPMSWHDHTDAELIEMANLVTTLDGEGALLEQMKRYVEGAPPQRGK